MTEDEKWQYLVDLDDALLEGAVVLSEWAAFLIRDADTAFVAGAHLASLITGLAAVETHLRADGCDEPKTRLADLIDKAQLDEDLREELQSLRKYRNKWVHVSQPWKDESLVMTPERDEAELAEMAKRCAVAVRRTIYANPWL